MKRVLCVLLLLVLAGYALLRPTLAQDPAKQSMRADVLETLSKFSQAANKGDVLTLAAMVSNKPGVVYIADGTIMHGPTGVSQALDSLIGSKGKYELALGVLDVANVNGLALATGPYVLTTKGQAASTVAQKGAITVLLENQGKKMWVITHIHRSTLSAAVPDSSSGQ